MRLRYLSVEKVCCQLYKGSFRNFNFRADLCKKLRKLFLAKAQVLLSSALKKYKNGNFIFEFLDGA